MITFKQFDNLLKIVKPTDRISFSFDPQLKLKTVKSQLNSSFKPKGLWYALGPAWLKWMQTSGEDSAYWLQRYQYVYKLDLNMDRMLQLKTYKDIENLTKTHGTEIGPGGFYKLGINWASKALAYSGVEIWPYNKRAHNDFAWYNTWSIASGCIWKSDAIAQLTKLEI